jgi:Cu2+-exporting ATPase
MRQGTLIKSGTALERLAEVEHAVFDKTGTLTLGRPALDNADAVEPEAFEVAASMAAASRHPLARALTRAYRDRNGVEVPMAEGVAEEPGRGLALGDVRLGSRDWCGMPAAGRDGAAGDAGPELWLARPGRAPVGFFFSDAPRADAANTVARLKAMGISSELLSGDRPAAVAAAARAAGIDAFAAEQSPADKVARLARLRAEGYRVLMVGDGLNDAPALQAADVSLSPASAADVAQTAADAVFQGDHLAPAAEAVGVARRAHRLVLQNFALAFAYNAVTVPLAVAGLVTPLIAAVAMSASSLVVIGNALRLAKR